MPLKVGLQLYSVRESMKGNPYEALSKVAEAGYKYIEAANHNAQDDDGIGFGVPVKELRKQLDSLGLNIIGSHIAPLDMKRLPAILDYHRQLGNRYIGNDIEFFPYGDRDAVLRRCELFNRAGEMCSKLDMKFYYHNHYQEFQEFGGETVYDLIMQNTNPEFVFAEMDTYWVFRGGHNAIDWINKYKNRLLLLHQKDFPENAPQPLNMYDGVVNKDQDISLEKFLAVENESCFTEIGTGVLPIQDIINAASQAPFLEYIVLEQDYTKLDEIASIKTSMESFRKYSGIAWA